MTPFDVKRLDSYANNMLDYHVILDLLPKIASLYFEKRLGDEVHLSAVQSSILLGLGLQRKTIEDVEAELNLPVSQALALFSKVIRKVTKRLQDVQKAAITAELADSGTSTSQMMTERQTPWQAMTERSEANVDAAVNEAVRESDDVPENRPESEETRVFREKQREMIQSLDLSKYAINDEGVNWALAESQVSRLAKDGAAGKSSVVSLKSSGPPIEKKRKADDGRDADKKKTRRGKKVKR